jgi:hypothetical protein
MRELISRSHFEKLVTEHKTEHGAKGLKSWTQFVSMLFAHISGQHGLRSIERGMNSHAGILYHLGIPSDSKRIKRSSLSYANNKRSGELFKGVFEKVLALARGMKSPHGFRFKNPLYSIDSTTIDLCLRLFPWADFRTGKAGIKLTVKLDHRGKIPCFAIQTNARQHDAKAIREVPLQAGDIAVFDRGYMDYGYFKGLCEQKVWFVTRLQSNAQYRRIKKNKVKGGGKAVSDYEVHIPSLSREIVFRKVTVRDKETGKKIVLLTNNLQWSAETIGAIYRERWQIELFFKAMKQNLKIQRFYGNSKNAVMTRIWIALIAYLLFYILKMKSKNLTLSFTCFISVIKTIVFQRISLWEWLMNPIPPQPKPVLIHQAVLDFVW